MYGASHSRISGCYSSTLPKYTNSSIKCKLLNSKKDALSNFNYSRILFKQNGSLSTRSYIGKYHTNNSLIEFEGGLIKSFNRRP